MEPGVGYLLRVDVAQRFSYESLPVLNSFARLTASPVLQTLSSSGTDWQAPPGKRNSMVVYAQVRVNGLAVDAVGSKLAAFEGDQVVGISEIMDGPGGSKLYQITVHSDMAVSSEISFKVHNAATGATIDLQQKIEFVADGEAEGLGGTLTAPRQLTSAAPAPSGGTGGTTPPTSGGGTSSGGASGAAATGGGGGSAGGGGNSGAVSKNKGKAKKSVLKKSNSPKKTKAKKSVLKKSNSPKKTKAKKSSSKSSKKTNSKSSKKTKKR
jgi:uncharacterized membrane protein YgcG